MPTATKTRKAAKKAVRPRPRKARGSGRITDDELRELVDEFHVFNTRKKLYEAKAEKRKVKIIKELQARKIKTIDFEGVRVTMVQNEGVNYDPVALAKKLGKGMWQRVSTRVLDPNKLAQAIQQGKVDAADADECSEIVKSAPYIRVTPRDD